MIIYNDGSFFRSKGLLCRVGPPHFPGCTCPLQYLRIDVFKYGH